MNKHIQEVNFTIFDTETTGLDPQSGDRIIEIAATRLTDGETFSSLVNPGRTVSPAAFAVNHISEEMLRLAPTIDQVMPRFLEFIKGTVVCSYNVRFDIAFLKNELKIMNQDLPQGLLAIDVLTMARRLLPGIDRHALWYVADNLGIRQEQEHRAASDVDLTMKVFNKFKEMLLVRGIFDFHNIYNLFGLSSAITEDLNNQKIIKIQEAIDLGVRIKIRYLARTDAQVTEREVEPLEIKQENNQMYLVGYCNLRQDKRTFRIDGILNIEIV